MVVATLRRLDRFSLAFVSVIGKALLAITTMAFFLAIGCLFLGAYLTSRPLMRRKNAQMQALTNAAAALIIVGSTLKTDRTDSDGE